MEKWMRRFLVLMAVLWTVVPQTALAAADASVVGQSASIVSALTLPDYTKSTVCESDLGRLTADALKAQTGSDLAIVCGGELAAGLPKGPVTEADVLGALPGNSPVVILAVDAGLLWETLEYGLSFSVLGADETIDRSRSEFIGFPQISGFAVEYDVSQLPGERVRYIRLADGTRLEKDGKDTLTVAVSGFLLDPETGYTMLRHAARSDTGCGTAELLMEYIRSRESVSPDSRPRIRAVGTAENTIVNELGILPFLPIILIVILLVSLPRGKRQLRNLDGSRSKRYRDYGDGTYDS